MKSTNESVPNGAAEIAVSTSWRDKNFKKSTIPCSIRVHLAQMHGCACGGRCPAWCSYCGAEGEIIWWSAQWITFSKLEMDHVIAEFVGGKTSKDNIVLACRKCNRSKGIKRIEAWRPSVAL